MISLVLQRLETLQANLATVDPTRETDAADQVAAMAVALRDLIAGADLVQRSNANESAPVRLPAVA